MPSTRVSLPPLPRPPLPTTTLGVGLAGARPRSEAAWRRPSLQSTRRGGGGGSRRPGRPNFESLAGQRGGRPACPVRAGESSLSDSLLQPERRASKALRLSAAVLINKPLPPPRRRRRVPGSPAFRVADAIPPASRRRPNRAPRGGTPLQLGPGRGAGGWEPAQETEGGSLRARRREEGRGAGGGASEVASESTSRAEGGAWAVPGLPAPAALQLCRASLKLCR